MKRQMAMITLKGDPIKWEKIQADNKKRKREFKRKNHNYTNKRTKVTK